MPQVRALLGLEKGFLYHLYTSNSFIQVTTFIRVTPLKVQVLLYE